MGSNMQRQGVPLLKPEAPIVGTGLEARAARDSGAVVIAEEDGVVEYVDGFKIVIAPKDNPLEKKTYQLEEIHPFQCRNMHQPDSLFAMSAIRSRPGMSLPMALLQTKGRLLLVKTFSWPSCHGVDTTMKMRSSSLKNCFAKTTYTSIYIEEFELTARDTKLGKEEITRDIPNVSEEALVNLAKMGLSASALK